MPQPKPQSQRASVNRKLDWTFVSKFIRKDERGPVIDLGCGNSTYITHMLQRRVPSLTSLIGVDIDPNYVAGTKAALGGSMQLVVADAEHMPFRDGSCRLIVSNCMIEHLGNDEAFISESSRVLKEGGMLIITADSHPDKPTLLTRALCSLMPKWLRDSRFESLRRQGMNTGDAIVQIHRKLYRVVTYYDIAGVRDKMQRHGLKIEEWRYYFNGLVGRFLYEMAYCSRLSVIGRRKFGRFLSPLWDAIMGLEFSMASHTKKGYVLGIKAVKEGTKK